MINKKEKAEKKQSVFPFLVGAIDDTFDIFHSPRTKWLNDNKKCNRYELFVSVFTPLVLFVRI